MTMWKRAVPAVAALTLLTACQGDGDGAIVDLDTVATPAPDTTAGDTTADSTTPDTATPTTADTTSVTDATATPVTDPPADATQPDATVPDDVLATTATTRPEPAVPATATVYPEGSIDPGLTPFVEIATVDLSERLGVGTDAIETLTAVLVTWPDASLGCPEPGQVYAQVLTDGSVIELGFDGSVYRYHSGGSRTPFPCDRPLDPVPPAQS